jgi:flagellar motor switch protein FliN
MIAAVPDVEPPPDGTEPVRIKLALAGSLNGEVHLECHRVAACIWASKLLGHQSEEFGAEQSEALLKMVTDGVKEFRAELVPEYGEFTISVSSISEPPSGLTRCEQITIISDKDDRASLLMYLSPILIESLSQHLEGPEPLEDPVPVEDPAPIEVPKQLEDPVQSEDPKHIEDPMSLKDPVPLEYQSQAKIPESPMQGALKRVINEQVNLDLVMDVELNVTLRFGQRRLSLREVLELTTGSVIELDRQVEEPVELLLEGKIIARGEAVVIDGNYGLRVTEVLPANFCPILH